MYSIPFENDTPLEIKILVSLKSSINIVNILFGLMPCRYDVNVAFAWFYWDVKHNFTRYDDEKLKKIIDDVHTKFVFANF